MHCTAKSIWKYQNEKSLKHLQEAIRTQEISGVNLKDLKEIKEADESDYMVHKTIKHQSLFYQYFKDVYVERKGDLEGKPVTNKYNNPPLCNFLVETYLHLYPLWSGILLDNLKRYDSHNPLNVTIRETRDTNAVVETGRRSWKLIF